MFRLARICVILAIALLLVAAPAAAQPGQPTAATNQSSLISDIEISQGLGKQLYGARNHVAGRDAAPFPVGTTAFRILSGTVPCQIAETGLSTVPVSTSEPTLAITAPATPGATISGVYTITWSAEDADGDTLIYTVEYARDGVTWEVLISDLTEATWTVGFGDLGGSNAAQIRVTATDGANTVRATSVPFVVPFKAPEVYIDNIENGDRYDYGEEVALEGAAFDLQDETLPDASLVWRSDRQGVLGRGSLIFADNLLAGPHVISLSATNSVSLTTVATATLTIGHPLTPETARQSGPAGATLTYTLRLTNTAAVADTFALSAVDQTWATQIATSSPVALAAGAATDITVRVTIPTTATVPASDEVFILAASETFTNTLSSEPLTAASLLISSVQGSSYRLFLPLVRKG